MESKLHKTVSEFEGPDKKWQVQGKESITLT
jgi:hypothetical protein